MSGNRDNSKDEPIESIEEFFENASPLENDPASLKLYNAVYSGQASELIALIEDGVNPNTIINGGTLLTNAIVSECDSFLKVRYLLEAGADLEIRDEGVGGLTPLFIAASNDKPDIVRLLVHHGADINSQASLNRWTALMAAACMGSDSSTSELLKLGADLFLRSEHGDTAIDIARANGRHSVLKIFLGYLEKKNAA